jgi:hypothetical protein
MSKSDDLITSLAYTLDAVVRIDPAKVSTEDMKDISDLMTELTNAVFELDCNVSDRDRFMKAQGVII